MPRKPLRERKGKNPTDTDTNVNRVRNILDNLIGTEDPDDLMQDLMKVLTKSGKIPQPGKFYIFVYIPKTSNIQYDQNPFVAVTDVYKWGFTGINFHWEEKRQYTWNEIFGDIYEVYASEVRDLQEIPFQKIRLNS